MKVLFLPKERQLDIFMYASRGRFINPHKRALSEKSLAEALREGIMNPRICKRYGKNGREWVLDNFAIEKMCESTVKLHHSLIL
jgi:glycosyltransferase involved in cell wall biosynthesis